MVNYNLLLNILNSFPDRSSYESILVLLVCCTILYLSRLIERRSGAGRAY